MSGFFGAIRKATSASSDEGCSSVPRIDSAGDMKFTIQPLPGDTGFSQWATAMKMVAQLPGGIPAEFRRRLWLTLAEKHLVSKGVKWPEVERTCFSEWSHPADAELGVQIVKDLHRTGCSLFCGEDGQENQALLKRVLLAYARWNKAVGYCQGFNMLAALILQVTEKCESDALKLMIYLIEGVLPDSYFADNLRGLSVDMAVFRELLRSRLPRLSKHLDLLQNAAKEGRKSYEPPLTNVFTMQWFLTLFCNCLPHATVLRVWDLILLEGNEILLRTALAIWRALAERISTVRTADEFYSVMGVLMRDLSHARLIDCDALVAATVAVGPLAELRTLREHYLYDVRPWGPPRLLVVKSYAKQLDMGALKKQYDRLRQRQRQAHVVLGAAPARQPPRPTPPPVTLNHLLVGRSALGGARRPGPPEGAVPPARQPAAAAGTLLWKDAPKQDSSSSSSSDTELCDEEEEEGAGSDEEAAPRSSARALQIIQENSVILHRILQCQSRLPPPPPLVDVTGDVSVESPEYGSKYSSILAKSKSLDEKYHELMSSKPNASHSCAKTGDASPIRVEDAESLDSDVLKFLRSYDTDEITKQSNFDRLEKSPNSNEAKSKSTPSVNTLLESHDMINFADTTRNDNHDKLTCGPPLTSSSVEDPGLTLVNPVSHLDSDNDVTLPFTRDMTAETADDDQLSFAFFSENEIRENEFDYLPNRVAELVSRVSPDKLDETEDKCLSDFSGRAEIQIRTSEHEDEETLSFPEDFSSIRTKTEPELGNFSGSECRSRSTSPFISDDWYNTERNNKNLGVEVVAVGGSSCSKSPSRKPPSLSATKSPSKCFNPFPVPLGSRPTKEVPIKLGLYKK